MKSSLFLILLTFLSFLIVDAQEHPDLKIINQVKTSPVKSQGRTGTCWSFATTSFIESEALRLGKKELDLSEMYFVYYTYMIKANDYVRYWGMANFSEGGQAHDVMNVIKNVGIVPESEFSGKKQKTVSHNHKKLSDSLTIFVKNVVKDKKNQKMDWVPSFKQILDSVLGYVPGEFVVDGKTYWPKSYNKDLVGINPDDYIEFTSYIHHPYYEQIDLEVPDNWSHDRYYNLPIDELIEVMNYSLKNGFSISWDGDVSEKGFYSKTGLAVLSETDQKQIAEIGCQEYRQVTFNDFTTTDDHLMHVTGISKDKEEKLFYITKNSWGSYGNYKGYLFMSEDYVRIKTVAFMVHKDAVPEEIAKKIGIK